MFFKNMPFGAKLALHVANEALKDSGVFEQPTLFLESHRIDQKEAAEELRIFRTVYSVFGSRDRIEVTTILIRSNFAGDGDQPQWIVTAPAKGYVAIRISKRRGSGRVIHRGFLVTWETDENDLLDYEVDFHLQPRAEILSAQETTSRIWKEIGEHLDREEENLPGTVW